MRLQPCPINSSSGGTLFIWQDRILTYKDGPHAERVITYIFFIFEDRLGKFNRFKGDFMDKIHGSNQWIK